MSWLVDNAAAFCILLGVIAAGLIVACRFSGRVKYLGYAAGVLVLAGLIWLVAFFFATDAKQLRSTIDAMAGAVEKGNADDLFKHISNDLIYEFDGQKFTRGQLYEVARQVIQRRHVGRIRITQFDVVEIPRGNKTAKVKFKVSPFNANGDPMPPFVTQAQFVLEGEEWKLKTVDFYKSLVNTDEKIGIPGL